MSPESEPCPIIYLNSLCLECAVYVRDGGESEALVGALEDLPPGSLGGGRLAAEHRLRGRHLAGARHRGTEVPGHFTPLKPQDSLAADPSVSVACYLYVQQKRPNSLHTVNKRAKTSDYYAINVPTVLYLQRTEFSSNSLLLLS